MLVKLFRTLLLTSACGTGVIAGAAGAAAQTVIDRVDPVQIERNALPAPAKVIEPKPVIEGPSRSPVAPQATGAIDVGAIMFDGLVELEPADFADIVARYIGRTLSSAELVRLAEDVSARARGRGLVFASARIEPQRLTAGVLVVRFDPGMIDEVRVDGDASGAVQAALAPLIGQPATLGQVERRLLIAGDIDGVSVRRSRFVREGGRGVLLVDVVRDAIRVRVVVENDSTAPVGPVQARIDADMTGLLSGSDALSVTYVATPFEPDELQYVRARYAQRISVRGTELSIGGSAAETNPGAYLDPLDLRGRSWSANVGVSQPLYRRRDASLWFTAELTLRDSQLHRSAVLRRHDRIFALRAGVYGNRAMWGGRLRGSFTLSRGLDGLGATQAGDPDASRDDADGIFTHAVVTGDWTGPIGGGFSTRIAAQAQVASGPLLIAEEIGIGGSAFLRGYDYSERSGDEGYMGLAELRYDWRNPLGLGRKAQVYGFVDGGRVTNFRDGFGGGGLASGGGGVRADVSPSIDANVEVAVPLTGPRFETGDRDPRINLRVLKVF